MNRSPETLPAPTIAGPSLKTPLIPAALVRLGTELPRLQPSGYSVTFRSVLVTTKYTGVPSMYESYGTTWFTRSRQWIPLESLAEGQFGLTRRV